MQAIGYIRFSSEEQADGHSIERQTDNVSAYCHRVGLQLTGTIIDEGLSAFKGHHIATGNLGKFLAEADKGLHRGKALVVEHLDRLSRLGITETGELLKRLIKAGVEVHITQENRVVRSTDDLLTAIMNVIGAYSGQEYSKKLRERVSVAWTKKKHHSENGKAITSILPSWLTGKVGEQIQVNEDRAEVVRMIFRMASEGLGKRLIARRLAERGIRTFGRSGRWSPSSVGDLLTNRAVIGEYQPHTGKRAERRPEGEVRIGFYPVIVEPRLWQAVQDTLVGRRAGRFSGRTGKVRNLFTGLVFDVTNGEPISMGYIDKGTRSTRNLSTEKNGSGKPRTINYSLFEYAFLTFLDEIDWKSVMDVKESEEIQAVESEVSRLQLEIERIAGRINIVIDTLIDTPSQSLKDRLVKLESEQVSHQSQLEAARSRLEELRRKSAALLDESIAFKQLSESKDVEVRAKLREEIRKKVSRIEVRFGKGLQVKLDQEDDISEYQTLAMIRFVNGAIRGFMLKP